MIEMWLIWQHEVIQCLIQMEKRDEERRERATAEASTQKALLELLAKVH